MNIYEHSQIGTSIIIAISIVVGIAILIWKNHSMTSYFMITIAIVVLALFYKLKITVNDNYVSWSFGIGIIHGQQSVQHIQTATVVKNAWYSGWGIRYLRNGTLYNVSGFNAVELVLSDNSVIRLGTDQPEKLAAEIRKRITSVSVPE